MSLIERMRVHKVPGVSISVIRDYKIDWVKSYGVKEINKQEPIDNNTLFQVGSISKSIVAIATFALVEQKKLSLDADINGYLKTWKLPGSRFSNQKPVTIRHILSHSAGLRGEGRLSWLLNFNDFINQYRVQEAQRRLVNEQYSNLTIEGIGKEVASIQKQLLTGHSNYLQPLEHII